MRQERDALPACVLAQKQGSIKPYTLWRILVIKASASFRNRRPRPKLTPLMRTLLTPRRDGCLVTTKYESEGTVQLAVVLCCFRFGTCRDLIRRILAMAFASVLFVGLAPAEELRHAVAMHGEPALPAGFDHFAYANP